MSYTITTHTRKGMETDSEYDMSLSLYYNSHPQGDGNALCDFTANGIIKLQLTPARGWKPSKNL